LNNHISCAKCGSHAINEHLHGRKAGKHPELCDVCYWRAEYNLLAIVKAIESLSPAPEVPWTSESTLYDCSTGEVSKLPFSSTPSAEVPPEPIVYTGIHPFTHQPMRATLGNFDSSGGKIKDMEQRILTLESEIQGLKECLELLPSPPMPLPDGGKLT